MLCALVAPRLRPLESPRGSWHPGEYHDPLHRRQRPAPGAQRHGGQRRDRTSRPMTLVTLTCSD
eukprot:277545-Alexandrium_andersonii.AAC.1